MLFFFELAFFLLAVLALVLSETAGRAAALIFWAIITTLSLLSGPIVRRRTLAAPTDDRLETRWRRTLVESWRHLDRLLLLGLLALAAWWWLGQLQQ